VIKEIEEVHTEELARTENPSPTLKNFTSTRGTDRSRSPSRVKRRRNTRKSTSTK